jgi:hypothetical protein
MQAHAAALLKDLEARPDSPEASIAHRATGITCWFAGEYLEARDHFEAVRVVPSLARVAAGLPVLHPGAGSLKALRLVGVFSPGCSGRASTKAAISQRVRQLPRLAIISSADIVSIAPIADPQWLA